MYIYCGRRNTRLFEFSPLPRFALHFCLCYCLVAQTDPSVHRFRSFNHAILLPYLCYPFDYHPLHLYLYVPWCTPCSFPCLCISRTAVSLMPVERHMMISYESYNDRFKSSPPTPGPVLASMLAAATSFFARTAISQSYNIGISASGSRPSTPSHGDSSFALPTSPSPSLNVGLWRVQSASHKVTNKRVSVWSFDKRGPDIERLGPLAKERTLDILKAEVGALSAAN